MDGFRSIFCWFAGVLLLVSSCTSARWTVQDPSAVDREDYVILDRSLFLSRVGEVSPQNPVLRLQLLSHTRYEYAEKVRIQRNIQDYSLRPGFVAISLLGAGLAVYSANSSAIGGAKSPTQQFTLNVIGGIIALSGFLNMKPEGEPRPTGEERFLRRTGSRVETDTLQLEPTEPDTAALTVSYRDLVLAENASRPFDSDILEIPLGSFLEELQITGESPGILHVDLSYRDSTYRYDFPVQSLLVPYARINAPVTELRNLPSDTGGTVLAELARGSQLQIVGREKDEWYRVLYGISENYIKQSDAQQVWRSSEFSRENQVIAMPQVPFGNIDVENNIPILSGIRQNAIGLIITNENYPGDVPGRTYAGRDARLIHTYLENALGYTEGNLFTLEGTSSRQVIGNQIEQIRQSANDSTELFVYLSGYGVIRKEGESVSFRLMPVDSTSAGIDLAQLFGQLASVPSGKTVVLADINFREITPDSVFRDNELLLDRAFRNSVEMLADRKPQSVILTGSGLGQRSHAYVSGATGEDKKHRIFPYFFARALQQRMTRISTIYSYLERNISYTSRRLHDRAQDPQAYGNLSINLVEN